ncbi:MAG: S8 family serine peptidase, partial [Myxococcota bacterium]
MAPSRSVPLFGSALTSAALLLAGSGCDGVSIITDPDMGPGGSLTKGVVTGELSIFTPGAVGPEATATEARAAPSFDAQAVMSALRARLPTKTAARGLEGVELELELPGGSAWALPRDPDASFVPGELLVTFRSQGLEAVPHLSENPDLALWRFEVGVFGGPAVATVRIRDAQRPDRAIGPDETLWLRDRLATHEAFRIVELNRYRWPLAEPNDQAFAAQWHYPKMNLPAAWDITQGSPQVVVAVIDDGVNPHPDLTRSMGGFDMISDVAIAGDGDGRDAVPSQVPLSHGTSSVWHGTHVAGTVGATTDNGQGAAGVDWNARILPVRVLGKVIPGRGAGTSVDIIAGMNWAVGIDVPQAPTNTNPADVLNLSLGGGGLVQAEQEAINAAVGRGAAVVVAAGNENRDAGLTSLAGYQNVIVVGATDHGGRRAPYSNFGPAIDIMAPGGHLGADANADGRPDGVLSTFLDESGQQTGFAFLEGTSMASPHAAGVAALMKAVRPNITPAEIEQIMKDTAVTSSRCNEGCGAGLVNAAAAVIAAQGGANPMAPPSLALGSERVNIGSQSPVRFTT